MPKEIKEMKQFLLKARSPGVKHVTIKKDKGGVTKFKLRCKKYLYTMRVEAEDKAKKVQKSLPMGMKFKTIKNEKGVSR